MALGEVLSRNSPGKGEAVVIADRDAERGAALESSIAAGGGHALCLLRLISGLRARIQALMARVDEVFGRDRCALQQRRH